MYIWFSEKGGVCVARFTFRSTTFEDHKILILFCCRELLNSSFVRLHLEINDQKKPLGHFVTILCIASMCKTDLVKEVWSWKQVHTQWLELKGAGSKLKAKHFAERRWGSLLQHSVCWFRKKGRKVGEG